MTAIRIKINKYLLQALHYQKFCTDNTQETAAKFCINTKLPAVNMVLGLCGWQKTDKNK